MLKCTVLSASWMSASTQGDEYLEHSQYLLGFPASPVHSLKVTTVRTSITFEMSLLSLYLSKYLFIHSFIQKRRKERARMIQRKWERQQETEKSSIYWFIPKMPTTAWTGSAQSQMPETQYGSPTLVARAQLHKTALAASQGAHSQGVGLEAKPELESQHCDTGCRHPK